MRYALQLLALPLVLITTGCSDSPTIPELVSPSPLSTPAPIVIGPPVVYRAPLEAQLLQDARVRLVSGSDEEQLVRVRWESAIGGAYEQDWLVPPRAVVEAFPDCFYGGAYQVGILGHRISFQRDYGPSWAFCY